MNIECYHQIKKLEYKLLSSIPKEVFQRKDDEYKKYLANKNQNVIKFCDKHNLFSELPKIIHIAGSGGKGTVSHLLSYTLEKNGFSTGLFTSPHITSLLERIQINHELIQPEEFINIASKIIDLYENED